MPTRHAEVHGLDLDAEAIGRARAKARAEGLEDRVRFHVVDAEDHSLDGTFDLVTIFEAVHDMSRPVEVLEACRRLLAPGGTVIVMDEKVAEQFTVARRRDRAAHVRLQRVRVPRQRARRVAERRDRNRHAPGHASAGTRRTPASRRRPILPIEHEAFRFYRLDP